MKKWKSLLKYGGAFLLATFVANGICYFYYSPAVQVANHEKFTELKMEPGSHNPNNYEGFGNIERDANGFNNVGHVARREARTLFIGSSQTFGENVTTAENYVTILNEGNPVLQGYNLGVSAATFGSTFYRIAPIVEHFPKSETLVFEINAGAPSLGELQGIEQILEQEQHEIPERDISWKAGNPLLRALGRIPLVRLLWKQFEQKAKAVRPALAPPPLDREAYRVELSRVLQLAKERAEGRRIVIFRLPLLALEKSGNAREQSDRGEGAIFEEVCRANDILYIDMGGPFLAAYRERHVLPYGFSNSPIGTGHLNADGHAVLAETLSRALYHRGGQD